MSTVTFMVLSSVIAALGLILYLPSTNLLLFWDDVPHMSWLASQPNGAYWFTSAGFPFYRPTAFTVWELLHTLYSYHNPQALHALSVALHIINAVLVFNLAAHLTQRIRPGFWAGMIFVAFPFSFQTVIPTAAHFHLWLVFGLLSSAWLLLTWLEKPVVWRLILAWILAFWGIFSHENGVLAPVLIGSILAVDLMQRGYTIRRFPGRRLTLAIGPIAVLSTLYGLMWALVPKANEATGLELAALDVKLGQTWQALGFPVAALFQRVSEAGTTHAWVSGLVIVVTVGGAVWMRHVSSVQRRWIVLSILWIPLVMLPAWALLDVNYLLGSPRLHYLAAVGIAWVWGALLSAFPTRPRLDWTIGLVGTAICLMVAVPFVRARMGQHRTIDTIYRDVGNIATGLSPETRLLLINGPAYLALHDSTFPLGAEGSTYLPDFINLGDWLALNDFGIILADNRRADDLVPSTDLIFAVTHPVLDRSSLRGYAHVFMVVERDGELAAVQVGQRMETTILDEPRADFGNGIVLAAAYLNETLRLELTWEVGEITAPSAVFVHLLCDGRLVAQADGPPLGRAYPFELWMPGEQWHDYRYFDVPANQPHECLSVLVGLYDPISGDRFPIRESDGIVVELQ